MLRKKHLDALRLASIQFEEVWKDQSPSWAIILNEDNVVDAVEFLHENFPEDIPIIPFKYEENKYFLKIHND